MCDDVVSQRDASPADSQPMPVRACGHVHAPHLRGRLMRDDPVEAVRGEENRFECRQCVMAPARSLDLPCGHCTVDGPSTTKADQIARSRCTAQGTEDVDWQR